MTLSQMQTNTYLFIQQTKMPKSFLIYLFTQMQIYGETSIASFLSLNYICSCNYLLTFVCPVICLFFYKLFIVSMFEKII